jgi:hypothetical protein
MALEDNGIRTVTLTVKGVAVAAGGPKNGPSNP